MHPIIKSTRLWILSALALVVLAWYWFTDPAGGADTKVRLQAVAWGVVLASLTYLIAKGLTGRVRSEHLADESMRGGIGAGIAFAGIMLLRAVVFFALCGLAHGAEPPPAARALLPVLKAEQSMYWPALAYPSTLGAQVEQETGPCPGRQCWNCHAELKTSREYGVGLGQLTVTASFDNFAAARGLDASLRNWQWSDRYDCAYQLRALVLMDRGIVGRIAGAASAADQLQMAFAAYNGGAGGLSSDRRLCAQVAGCHPGTWFGHVERTSLKARAKVQGYGQSFFDVNRGYVRAVWITRRARYTVLGA